MASAVAGGVGGPGGKRKIKINVGVGAVEATRERMAALVDGYSGALAQLVRPVTQRRCEVGVTAA